jgi:hypothetical protein
MSDEQATPAPEPSARLRDRILAGHDRPAPEHLVMALGQSLRVRQLSPEQRDELDIKVAEAQKAKTYRSEHFTAWCVVACTFDADGQRVFDWPDVPQVASLPGGGRDLRRLWKAANNLNGFTDGEDEEGDGPNR